MNAVDLFSRCSTSTSWRGILAFPLCAAGSYAVASTFSPRPDPALAITADMQERFSAVCKTGVYSIDARHRPHPPFIEYAYIDCAPLTDEHGREITPVVYCEKSPSQSSWECRQNVTNVRATLAGKPIVYSYAFSTVEQSLQVLSFVLASPQLRTLVPAQWTPSKWNVHQWQGRFQVSGNAGSEHYIFAVHESRGGKTPFEMLEVIKCLVDTCHPIWSASKGRHP